MGIGRYNFENTTCIFYVFVSIEYLEFVMLKTLVEVVESFLVLYDFLLILNLHIHLARIKDFALTEVILIISRYCFIICFILIKPGLI